MHHRPLRRAAVLALVGLLAFAGVASADFVRADGDTITPGPQAFVDLGEVGPAAEITIDVAFELVCGHVSHADPGQTVTVAFGSATAPLDGGIVGSTPGTVGPVPIGWTADGEGCPDPRPTVSTGTPGSITLRAPSVPGTGYVFTTLWSRSVSPVGANDGNAFNRSSTGLSFTLDVVANTPPVLTVPAAFSVEGDTTGGWTAAFVATATDVEDDPDPVPVCSPAPGALLPLGTTTITCAVTDSAGMTDTDTVDVTVVDTLAPTLSGVPGDRSVTSDIPTGTVVGWTAPGASDVVDAAPVVACNPASGSTFPVGTTTVTCTATDASGNAASATFQVNVDYVPSVVATVIWGEPVAGDGATFVANRGRTVPIKASLFVDGQAVRSGVAELTLAPCGGGTSMTLPLGYSGGRWSASLDTSMLSAACYRVTAWIDGLDAGSFRIEVRGFEAAKAKASQRAR